jgi:phospholipid transport system substrate-binding protein
MTILKRCLLVLTAVVLVVVDHTPALAGAPTDQLRVQVEQVIKLLSDPALKTPAKLGERRVMIMKIADEVFDFREISQRTLGRHWQGRTSAEQAEFSTLFRDVLARAYVTQIENYSGEKVTFVNDAIEGDLATVRTKVITKTGTEIPVDYRMFSASARWRVYDVLIEGVSLVGNYRTQFNAIIQRKGYPELVAKLKEKHEEQLASAAPRAERRLGETRGTGAAATPGRQSP